MNGIKGTVTAQEHPSGTVEGLALAKAGLAPADDSLYPPRPEWTAISVREDTQSDELYEEELKWSREADKVVSLLQKSPFCIQDKVTSSSSLSLERWGDRFLQNQLGHISLRQVHASPIFFPPQIWRGGRNSKEYVAQWKVMRTTSRRKQTRVVEREAAQKRQKIQDWAVFEKEKGHHAEDDKEGAGYNEEDQEREDIMSDPDQFEDDEEDDYGQNYFDPGEEDEVDDMGGADEGGDYD